MRKLKGKILAASIGLLNVLKYREIKYRARFDMHIEAGLCLNGSENFRSPYLPVATFLGDAYGAGAIHAVLSPKIGSPTSTPSPTRTPSRQGLPLSARLLGDGAWNAN